MLSLKDDTTRCSLLQDRDRKMFEFLPFSIHEDEFPELPDMKAVEIFLHKRNKDIYSIINRNIASNQGGRLQDGK